MHQLFTEQQWNFETVSLQNKSCVSQLHPACLQKHDSSSVCQTWVTSFWCSTLFLINFISNIQQPLSNWSLKRFFSLATCGCRLVSKPVWLESFHILTRINVHKVEIHLKKTTKLFQYIRGLYCELFLSNTQKPGAQLCRPVKNTQRDVCAGSQTRAWLSWWPCRKSLDIP